MFSIVTYNIWEKPLCYQYVSSYIYIVREFVCLLIHWLSKATYNGTATVSLKEGPKANVPLGITLTNGGDISIAVDPKTTDNHFGNTPIQGKTA